jgi:hypothetical protein
LIRSTLFLLTAALVTGSFQTATAQNPVTALDRQLSRIDIGVSGAGLFTRKVSGTVIPSNAPNAGQGESVDGSNTVGALVDIRYIAKPFVGLEFNYSYARYTQNYSYLGLGVQSNANEYTLGYVATPKHPIFGFQPFVSAGAGSIAFKPTKGGGPGLQTQARAAYYYSAGLQQEVFGEHLGVRASFRQVFYLAPDFGANYLTIKQRTITSEPTVGFYLRF